MSVRKPYRSWRQKAAALTLLGSAWLTWYHAEPAHRAPLPEPTPIVHGDEHLESLVHPESHELPELDPQVAFKLARSLANLSARDIAAYERAGAALDIDPALLTTISIIESDGGVNLTPRAYTSSGDHVPQGHHHVKPRDLESVLDQARQAHAFTNRLEDTSRDDLTRASWRLLEGPGAVLTDADIERADAYFTVRTGTHRMVALAGLIPEDMPETFDLNDAYESALASSVMTIFNAAYLSSHGIPADDRARLLAYTAGPVGTRRALPDDHTDASAEVFSQYARSAAGSWGEWYVENGTSILEWLRSEPSIEDARARAHDLFELAQRTPEATEATLGSLYMRSASDARLIPYLSAAVSREGRENINTIADAYSNR